MIRNFKDNPAPDGANPRGSSKSLILLTSLVKSGELAISEIEPSIRFAVALRDNQNARHRERLRASEFILTVISKSAEAAALVDKISRLDSGDATERVEVFAERPTDEQLDQWQKRHTGGG